MSLERSVVENQHAYRKCARVHSCFTSATLGRCCSKWSAVPRTGFIDITTSKDFYHVFSGLQFLLIATILERDWIGMDCALVAFTLHIVDTRSWPCCRHLPEDVARKGRHPIGPEGDLTKTVHVEG